ncbi:MAG: hypothetical protein NUW23_01265 [Firmicutes bacterium]|jgi:hypothetical protein|nr:hypothetical protein [Bacillota bacterium]
MTSAGRRTSIVSPYAILLGAGIALLALGLAFGDFPLILQNARLICFSCIGLE